MSRLMTTSRSPATRRRNFQPKGYAFLKRSLETPQTAPRHDTPPSCSAFPIEKLDLATLAIECVPLGHDEDDITTGAAYLHLHRKWRQLQEAVDKPAYLKQVRRNLCATARRVNFREIEAAQSDFERRQPETSESPDEAFAAHELRTRLDKALRKFDPAGLIVQSVLENQTYGEIAERHGVSAAAIRGRVRRALSNIRKCLPAAFCP